MKKIMFLMVPLALSLIGCAKEPAKCSDSKQEILSGFNSVMDNNTKLIGIIAQTTWFENPQMKMFGLQQGNVALKDSEKTLLASSEEQLNKDCNPEVDLLSLKQSISNMLTYSNAEIKILNSINSNASDLISKSGCANEEGCQKVLQQQYDKEMEPVLENFKNQIKTNKLSAKGDSK